MSAANAFNLPPNPVPGQIATLPSGDQMEYNGYAWEPVTPAPAVYPIAIDKGGTNATTVAGARANLGIDPPTGPFKLVDGTAAAPGLAFASKVDLGLYKAGDTILGIASRGARLMMFNMPADDTASVDITPKIAGTAAFYVRSNAAESGPCISLQASTTGTLVNSYMLQGGANAPVVYRASQHSFDGPVNFLNGATGITKAMVGLGSVDDARQVRAFVNGTVYIGWGTNMLECQVDNTYFGTTWPINITGNASGNAASANRTLQSDNCENWGFASANFSLPYMRYGSGGSLRYLIFQTNQDNTVSSFRTTSGNSVLEISGSGGAFGVGIAPSDIRLKDDIAPSTVNASAAVQAMEFIEYTMAGNYVPLGFSAQNLESINSGLVYGIEQPEDSPLHDLGTVLQVNNNAVIACLGKALQEALARITQLENA